MMLAKVLEAPEIAEDVLREASRIGGKVTDVVKDRVRVANEQIRRSRDAAEEMLHETTRSIKRRPLASVAVVFAAGFLSGSLFTFAMRRR
jgi:ElaB/YqjD/DUF883 family membrane-anchored ribosome-binding protein